MMMIVVFLQVAAMDDLKLHVAFEGKYGKSQGVGIFETFPS